MMGTGLVDAASRADRIAVQLVVASVLASVGMGPDYRDSPRTARIRRGRLDHHMLDLR